MNGTLFSVPKRYPLIRDGRAIVLTSVRSGRQRIPSEYRVRHDQSRDPTRGSEPARATLEDEVVAELVLTQAG